MAQAPPAVPKKKKVDEDEKPIDKAVSRQSQLPRNTQAGADQSKAVAAEEAASKAEITEQLAPYMLHDSKSKLSLGDAAELGRLQREEGLSKKAAEKKLLWQKDMKSRGVTAGQAATGKR